MTRIAIVEDKRHLMDSLLERLKAYPDIFVMLTASNGQICLDKLADCNAIQLPEVILMDIEMDVMNGVVATQKVKELYPQIEVMMLTVFDDDEKIFEAIKAGASGYLLKDTRTEKIYEALIDLKNGGSQLSPSIAKRALAFLKGTSSPKPQEASKSTAEESSLTKREMEILELVVQGLPYPQVGERLFISHGTVRTHVKNIFEKLQVKNKQEATHLAVKKKWFWK